MTVQLYLGDCIEVMATLPTGSMDAIICDLPYGTTYCKWDAVIPLEAMWQQIKRILKDNGPFVTTADEPFKSALVMSNPKWFRHEWVWNKVHATNFANANHMPMKIHEHVVVFCGKKSVYNPQKTKGAVNHKQGSSRKNISETRMISDRTTDDLSGLKFPQSIQVFEKHSSHCGLHPTQKPVALYEYLVRTYTNEGDVVLDFAMGSGTTAIACINTNRNFIGCDNNPDYFSVAQKRIVAAQAQLEVSSNV